MLNLLNVHYHIQKGIFFEDNIVTDTFTIYNSKKIDDIFWNYAILSELSSFKKTAGDIFQKFREIKRKPCVYINAIQSNDLRELQEEKFIVKYTESWLRYNGSPLQYRHPVRKISTEKEYKDFTSLFSQVNSKRYPDCGIYTPAYLPLMNETYNSPNFSHFIAYEENCPVAAAAMGHYNGYCIIYNLATLPEYQGKGYTQSVIRACIDRCKELGGKEIFALVNSDSSIERWLMKHEFKKIYTGYGLSI